MKKIINTLGIFSMLLLITANLYAKDITIIYTGQSHAMLYPCSCPIQQDGGIARRATLIKELKKKYPNLLLLDSGNFTAGGLLDEYTQNSQLDMQRSEVNFNALELMQYDAVGVGSDEFNFGQDFFSKNIKKSNPVYLSANLEIDQVSPFMIKTIEGVKIGIIGLTDLSGKKKSPELKINPPEVVAEIIKSLKQEGVAVVILLSTLGETEDLKLISKVKGIDILLVGQNPLKPEPLTKVDSTFILRPAWQGRKLGKLNLNIQDGKFIDCQIEELVLSDKIADDVQINAILPRCYSDSNCKKEGFIGSCNNPGKLQAECEFKEPKRVNLRIITIKDCTICNDQQVLNLLKNKFPGIVASYLYYPDQAAQALIKDFSIQGLPAYIFGNEIQKEDNFSSIQKDFSLVNNFLMLKPEFSGVAYFLNRPEKKGSLDLFFSIFEKDAEQILTLIKEFKPALHFLAIQNAQGFGAKNGNPEVQEYLRGVCIQKNYPREFWDYLICRAKNINNPDWEGCLKEVDLAKVKSCAGSEQGAKLLSENISLNQELEIMFGPVYLVDNQRIFSTKGVPAKKELERIIKEK